MTTSFSSSWKRLASTRQLSLLTLKLEKVSDIPSWSIKKVYLNKVQSEVISKLSFISPQNHLFHYMCFTESPAKPIMNSTALSGTKHLLPWRDSSWCQPASTLSLTWQTAVHLRFCLFYFFHFSLTYMVQNHNNSQFEALFSPDVITSLLCVSLTCLYFTWCFYFVFGPVCCLWALCPLPPFLSKGHSRWPPSLHLLVLQVSSCFIWLLRIQCKILATRHKARWENCYFEIARYKQNGNKNLNFVSFWIFTKSNYVV